jgi:hypothetical protein
LRNHGLREFAKRSGNLSRILEKQNHLMINVRIQKKLGSCATSFAF